jgi:hypothetical protein
VRASWNRFWFSDGPYFDLALARIGVVGLQLITLVGYQFENLTRVTSLPLVLYRPMVLMRLVTSPWGWTSPLSEQSIFAIYWATLLFGFGALLGLQTSVCMIVLAAGSIFLQTYVYSFGDFHHNEAILLLALAAQALGPCGRVLSIDSLIVRRKDPAASKVRLLDYCGQYAGWPIKFVQCLFPLVYLSAVISKIASSGYTLNWANGFTLQYYFLQDAIRKPNMALALWASQFHWPILLSQIVVLGYQLTYFLVLPYPKLRWIYLPVGLLFHLANWYVLSAPFPEWILLLGVYIPWSEAFKKLATTEVAVPVAEQLAPQATRAPMAGEGV